MYSFDFCLKTFLNSSLGLTASNLGFAISQSVFPHGLEQGVVSTPSGKQLGCQFSWPALPHPPGKARKLPGAVEVGVSPAPRGVGCSPAAPRHSAAHLGPGSCPAPLSAVPRAVSEESTPRRCLTLPAMVPGTASAAPVGGSCSPAVSLCPREQRCKGRPAC